jgi:NDP-sugar pyrophosphorylase family protein
MRIEHCLILAAGLGTRMGEIGKQLPKVLWPVFEKNLLELQVGYAKSLGVEKIYVNLHFMGKEIEEFCKTRSLFDDVEFLWERPDILDIGGAIHNLASKVNYKGRLLVLNADQFFYLKKEDLTRILEPFKKAPGVLFSYWVNSSLGYNALEINSDRFVKGIIKNNELPSNLSVETYTGISMIDLHQLDKTQGTSSFFETVCPFDRKQIPAILLENIDYWDFGTIKRYWETCFKILDTYRVQSNHPFLRFLVQEKALKTWKIDLQNISYHAKGARVINLNADEQIKDLGPSIILAGRDSQKESGPVIWWNDIKDVVK